MNLKRRNILIIALVIFTILGIVTAGYFYLKNNNKFCGGLAANLPEYQCPFPFVCKQLKGNYPDAGGTCVLISKNPEPLANLPYPKTAPNFGPKTSTTSTDPTANWKAYTSTGLAISFRYPPEWNLEETLSGVSIVVEPDIRMVVGACPGYSFIVSNLLDPKENQSVFLPVRQETLDNKSVEVFEKTNKYGCLTKRIYVSQFPREDYSPSLVITLGGKNSRNKLDQILSTFKFL